MGHYHMRAKTLNFAFFIGPGRGPTCPIVTMLKDALVQSQSLTQRQKKTGRTHDNNDYHFNYYNENRGINDDERIQASILVPSLCVAVRAPNKCSLHLSQLTEIEFILVQSLENVFLNFLITTMHIKLTKRLSVQWSLHHVHTKQFWHLHTNCF